MEFQELNGDQRREKVNSNQRFASWHEQKSRTRKLRGSLVWQKVKGEEYLARSYYDRSGIRRQKSEGKRSPQTEAAKIRWDQTRAETAERFEAISDVMKRQAAINRAVGLGRVPKLNAKIIRALDDAELLGNGLRIVGTNAIYAFEAAAGVFVDSEVTATLDIDLLMDARRSLRIAAEEEIGARSLLDLLRKSDQSFTITNQNFRAENKEGFLVDLIEPVSKPPWKEEGSSIGRGEHNLVAAAIEGLTWLENAPVFEAVAIDEEGWPLRMVVTDPRVFAAHKFWLSTRNDREPTKRQRDFAQARVTAQLTARYFPHLPYNADELRMIPRQVFEDALPLFLEDAPPNQ